MRQITGFRSKKELVYDSLRAAILKGELKPGTRLIIDDLASQLGVSQIPIREALQQLQADGFVTIKPYVGATVTEVHSGLVCEVFQLLEAMEIISGRAACQQMSDEDLDEMEKRLREMDNLIDDLDRWSEENIRLHQFICERAGTPLVGALMTKVVDHWERLRQLYLSDVFAHRVPEAQRQHWEILRALRARDPDLLEEVVRKHNRSALEAYTKYMESAGLMAPRQDTA
ncbi:MAG TPA: GntR family transcriptional regulator [Caldilineae bacterium]|nr:GntR family transcriptional regulator [Caldilineae bacterium]